MSPEHHWATPEQSRGAQLQRGHPDQRLRARESRGPVPDAVVGTVWGYANAHHLLHVTFIADGVRWARDASLVGPRSTEGWRWFRTSLRTYIRCMGQNRRYGAEIPAALRCPAAPHARTDSVGAQVLPHGAGHGLSLRALRPGFPPAPSRPLAQTDVHVVGLSVIEGDADAVVVAAGRCLPVVTVLGSVDSIGDAAVGGDRVE